MLRVAISVGALVAMVGTVWAGPAQDLGDAYRAYDAGELATAKAKLAKLDERKLANRDYYFYLRGMVSLRTGDPAMAKAAFAALAKERGSRFEKEVPWRLADVAWVAGDRVAAAAAYGKLAA
ncbi:MAG TPA: hypothetical protein VK427_15040, partial [Kofleriaceae bacterium]|nr:hypothetical protein [Kofleriaceae bacterium]